MTKKFFSAKIFRRFFTVFLLSQTFLLALAQDEARWKIITLADPNSTSGVSEKAVAVAQERNGAFVVAVERSSALSTTSTPLLYKTAGSGNLHWTVKSKKRGTPFDIVLNPERDVAYLIVSSPAGSDSSYSNGHVIRFSGISALATAIDVSSFVHEEVLFSTSSKRGNTKLFACVLDRSSGDLLLTGGTSDSLYGPSKGGSDVVVIRISQSGKVLASTQLGTTDDEFGRAIGISADSSIVSVAVQRFISGGGVESLLYRLNAATLEDDEGPLLIDNYGSTPLFTPSDVAVTGPTFNENNTRTTVICGSSITVPVRKTDMFFHVFSKIEGSDSDVPVYIDGAKDEKRDDHAVAIRAAPDGNFYSIGYSSPSSPSDSVSLTLTVLSPTGEVLYRIAHSGMGNTPEGNALYPTSMVLTEAESEILVIVVGYAQHESEKKPILASVSIPKGMVPRFKGFGAIVKGAGTDTPGRSDEEEPGKNSSRATPIFSIVGGVAGLVALLFLGLIIYTALLRRRRRTSSNPSKNIDAVTSEHVADEDISHPFPSREEVVFGVRNST